MPLYQYELWETQPTVALNVHNLFPSTTLPRTMEPKIQINPDNKKPFKITH